MFKNIYIDRKDNSFKLWLTNGKVVHSEFKCRSWEEKEGLVGAAYKTIHGVPVSPVLRSMWEEREDIRNGRMRHEIDIQSEIRILSEYYQNTEVLDFKIDEFNIAAFDIEVENGKGFPEPALAERAINLISIHCSKQKKYMVWGLKPVDENRLYKLIEERSNYYTDVKKVYERFGKLELHKNYEYVHCQSERELLEMFFQYCSESGIDIYTGWNSNSFDFPYIVNRCKRINVYNYTKLSPVGKVYLKETLNEYKKQEFAPVIGGVSCIDLLVLYKKFNLSQKESYKLDFITNEELEVGKVKLGDSGLGLAEKDWDSFVLYNIIDTNLVAMLDGKMGLIESLIGTCAEARIPLEYFFISKRVILGFFLTYMHRKGLVIPFLDDFTKEAYEGAYIKMNPKVYYDVVSLDAKAWYPSILRSCNISPETKVRSKTKPLGNFSKSVIEDVWYDNDKLGIIPEIVAFIVDGRDEFKKLQKKYSNPESPEYNKDLSEYYKRKQNAYKIFANSVYGLLGNNHFQFYDVDNAASITGIGNKAIQHVISYVCKWIDLKLPTDEKFKNEFGEYANVTIVGDHDEKYLNSFEDGIRASMARQRRLVLAHTDSFFLTYEDIFAPFKSRERTFEEYTAVKNRFSDKNSPDYNKDIAKYFEGMGDNHWNKMTLTEFTLRFHNCIFDEVVGKITKKWAKDYNYREDHLWFKLEKCSEVLVAMSKAHYICYLQYDEGDLLINLPFKKRLKAVGVELVKSDTPKWSKEHIMEVLESLFKENSRSIVAKKIGMLKKDFTSPENIHLISRPVSINSLGPTAANTFPAPRLGALKWNLILEEDKELSKYEPITEGTKVKWISVKEPNKFNISAISYNSENFPPELMKYFKIDYETQWDKTFRSPLTSILKQYGWDGVFEGDVESIRRFFKPK